VNGRTRVLDRSAIVALFAGHRRLDEWIKAARRGQAALSEHAAIEIGQWPGELSARQAVHEARALRAAVVTTEPGRYRGLPVTLNVI
jgi:hypothetical protein